jgi:ubiquitin-like protein Pup
VAQEQQHQQRRKASVRDTTVDETVADATNAELAESTEDVLSEIDDALEDFEDADLLNEIDDVLEENAEQFVADYQQVGGE